MISKNFNTSSDTIYCPYCGKLNKTIAHPVVKSSEKTFWTEQIFEDKFYLNRCWNCKKEYDAPYSTIYIDERNKAIIAYVFEEEEYLIIDKIEKEILTNDEMVKNYKIRIVRTVDDFKEKIREFFMEKDDRLIEMFKVWGLEELRRDGNNQEFIGIFGWVSDGDEIEIVYQMKDSEENGDNAFMMSIPLEDYQEAENELADFLNEMIEETYYVDFDWAMRVIAENEL